MFTDLRKLIFILYFTNNLDHNGHTTLFHDKNKNPEFLHTLYSGIPFDSSKKKTAIISHVDYK
jgi:hypothetical protein